MSNINNLKEIKEIIFTYLDLKKDQVFIFGSRAQNNAKKFSDLDIGIVSNREIRGYILEEIKEKFEESDLPYIIDLVNFADVSKEFRKQAMQKLLPLN